MPSTSSLKDSYRRRSLAYGVPQWRGGRTYYVGSDNTNGVIDAADSGNGVPGEDTYGVLPEFPFATLSHALAKVADHGAAGDTIYVLPNHTESISAAGDIAMNTSHDGVAIIGLGGPGTRPVFTWDTSTAATWTISTVGATLKNLELDMTGIDELVVGIPLTGPDCTFEDLFVRAQDSGGQVIKAFTASAAADRLTMRRVQIIGDTAAGTATKCIDIAALEDALFEDCIFDVVSDAGEGPVLYSGAATRQYWRRCIIRNNVDAATVCMDCNSLAVEGVLDNCVFSYGTISSAGTGLDPVVCGSGWLAMNDCGAINDQDETDGLPGSASGA
jgi:hypothetical protein